MPLWTQVEHTMRHQAASAAASKVHQNGNAAELGALTLVVDDGKALLDEATTTKILASWPSTGDIQFDQVIAFCR
jgi:hypothetical protein